MSPTGSHPDKGSVLLFCSEQTPLLPRLEEVSAFDEALTSGKVYVLLFGLSIHSLFEGLGNCSIFDFRVIMGVSSEVFSGLKTPYSVPESLLGKATR